MKVVGFAFKNNISSYVLVKLNIRNKFFVDSDHMQINKFVNKIFTEKPDYILGLGMYNRRDKDKLRIETQYHTSTKDYPINHFLQPYKFSKLANGIGNSYCNYVSMKISEGIKKNNLNAKYTFVHIPKSFRIDKAVQELEFMLKEIK